MVSIDKLRRWPSALPPVQCRVCLYVAGVTDMDPVLPGPVTADDVLSGNWMCPDDQAGACRARAHVRNHGRPVMCLVLDDWASGALALVTDNPRRAEKHAAYLGAMVVHLPVYSDYRKGGRT